MARNSATQNQCLNLKRLAAQRYLYSRAKCIWCVQVLIVSFAPIIAAAGTAMCEDLRSWGALLCVVSIALDGQILEWLKCRDRERAAAIQEDFDCNVLGIPWNAVLAGCRPTEEEVHRAANGSRRKGVDGLKNWYPIVVDRLPLYQSRIICQRINCSWDKHLRDYCRASVWALFTIIFSLVFATGLYLDLSTNELVVHVLIPVSPTLFWAIRESKQQGAAVDTSLDLQCRLTKLLEQTMKGDQERPSVEVQSRELQDKILLYRSVCPFVPDWIYRRFRKRDEQSMKDATEEIVNRIQAT